MTRDWSAARAKVQAENQCRVCRHTGTRLEAAHIISRAQVKPGIGEDPRNIVPLCPTCHHRFDLGQIDLLPYLTLAEQGYAVSIHPGGLLGALRRITNTRWTDAA